MSSGAVPSMKKDFMASISSTEVVPDDSNEQQIHLVLLDINEFKSLHNLLKVLDKCPDAYWTTGTWCLFVVLFFYCSYLSVLRNLKEKEFAVDIDIPELLVFSSGTNFHEHSLYKSGNIILQDKVEVAFCFVIIMFLINKQL